MIVRGTFTRKAQKQFICLCRDMSGGLDGKENLIYIVMNQLLSKWGVVADIKRSRWIELNSAILSCNFLVFPVEYFYLANHNNNLLLMLLRK